MKETQADKLSDTALFGINPEIISDKKLFEASNNLIHKNLEAYKELAQWFSLHNSRLKKCTLALSVQPAERYTQNELADLGLEIASGNITCEKIKKWISLHSEFDQVIWTSSFDSINIEPNNRLCPINQIWLFISLMLKYAYANNWRNIQQSQCNDRFNRFWNRKTN